MMNPSPLQQHRETIHRYVGIHQYLISLAQSEFLWHPHTGTLTHSRGLDWALQILDCFASVLQAFLVPDRKYLLLRRAGAPVTVLSCGWNGSVVSSPCTNVSRNYEYIESCNNDTKVMETDGSHGGNSNMNNLKTLWTLGPASDISSILLNLSRFFTSRSHSRMQGQGWKCNANLDISLNKSTHNALAGF